MVWEPATVEAAGQATGIAKAMGTATQADVAVAAVAAVVGMVESASEDEVTSVATRVAEARLEEGVVAVEANGAATV